MHSRKKVDLYHLLPWIHKGKFNSVFKVFFIGGRKILICVPRLYLILVTHRSTVRVIQSRRAGVGKTLRKNRCTQRIRQMIHAKAGSEVVQAVSEVLHFHFCYYCCYYYTSEQDDIKLQNLCIHLSFAGDGSVSIPLQDKSVDESAVLNRLLKNIVAPDEQKACIFHIDIAHEV